MDHFTTTTVDASDGTKLCLHSMGDGPGVVVLHGAMQSGLSHSELAGLLGPTFRVHLLDRRGRGGSGPLAANPSTVQEVDDVRAVLRATGAVRVFGVSSGAIVAGRVALADSAVERVALFEPPLSIGGSIKVELTSRVDAALDRNDLSRAMGIAMKAAEMGPPWMFGLPIPVLALASRPILRMSEMRRLAEALRADFAVVCENAERADDFAAILQPTLLIDGTSTRPYLRLAVETLAETIPGAQRVSLDKQGHSVTGNRAERGHPELVAPLLADFFE
ncbi:alpha/beta fold hydrolase [Subtercola sp. YIM 133946]|uniref:alpha/beta fold hydrolase n=1 Tax=Subtercola sp. YIM 133946 TaxID=3118909 RepID=UPI002F94156C